jgi:outer membrane protein assembly factor BamB
VFAALADGALVGLRADTGKAVWSTLIGQPVAPPAGEGDRLYAAAIGGALQALSVTDGTTAWRATLDSDATAMAAVAGHVFVATSGRWLYDIDAGRGRVRWRFRIQGAAIGLAVDEDRVIAVTLDQAVRAFKIGSGAQVWRQELAFRPAGGPAIAGSSVLITGFAPTIRAIDRRTGENQGLYRIPLETDAGGISLETLSAGPVLAPGATIFDDMLVLVTQHGLVHTARRIFDQAPSPITVLPGTPVTVPAPPPGMLDAPATPATPSPTAPAPTPPATSGTPTRTPPAPPGR